MLRFTLDRRRPHVVGKCPLDPRFSIARKVLAPSLASCELCFLCSKMENSKSTVRKALLASVASFAGLSGVLLKHDKKNPRCDSGTCDILPMWSPKQENTSANPSVDGSNHTRPHPRVKSCRR